MYLLSVLRNEETRDVTVADLRQLLASGQVIWADFDGPVDKDTPLAKSGKSSSFTRFHWRTSPTLCQRPKVEHFPKYHCIVTRMVNLKKGSSLNSSASSSARTSL